MIDIAAATPRTRCAYDHRLRDHVVLTGTRCLAAATRPMARTKVLFFVPSTRASRVCVPCSGSERLWSRYLREGRPQTARREVFLRHLAPFEPFGRDNNLHSIITKYRCLAGIELPRTSRKGLHALRHTVATRLLEAGVSLDTISGVMGHISPETTRLYTKVDLLALRSAALTLDEVEHA